MESLLKQLDKSGSGSIDFDDFVEGFGPWLLGDPSLLTNTPLVVETDEEPFGEPPTLDSNNNTIPDTEQAAHLKEIFSSIDATGKGITIRDFLKLIKVSLPI